MNKTEAYAAMIQGFKVRNEYFSPEEFAFINDEGNIETEDGVKHGGPLNEFWTKYQDPHDNWEWEIVSDADKFLHANRDLSPTSLPFTLIHPSHNIYGPYMGKIGTRKERQAIVTPVQPRSDINRNDPCMCGSGKKYKKCCM